MANEATDISNKEQLSVVVRYVDDSKVVREAFLDFCHLSDGCTGLAIKNERLKDVNDLNNRVYGIYCNVITVHNENTHRLWGYGSVEQ